MYAHILNKYAKKEEEEKKKKTADRRTFHRVLLRKSGEYSFSIICLMIVSGFINARCFS